MRRVLTVFMLMSSFCFAAPSYMSFGGKTRVYLNGRWTETVPLPYWYWLNVNINECTFSGVVTNGGKQFFLVQYEGLRAWCIIGEQSELGFTVTGYDPSHETITVACGKEQLNLRLKVASYPEEKVVICDNTLLRYRLLELSKHGGFLYDGTIFDVPNVVVNMEIRTTPLGTIEGLVRQVGFDAALSDGLVTFKHLQHVESVWNFEEGKLR